MTIGSVSHDSRVLADTSDGNKYTGTVSVKVWNGQDSTRPPPHRRVLHARFESSILKPNGKPYIIPAYVERLHPPNIGKGREDHPLTSEYRSESVETCYYLPASIWGENPQFRGPYRSSMGPGQAFSLPDDRFFDDNDMITLINRLRSRMQGSDFDPAAFLATSGESLAMIAGTAKRVDEFYRLLRRGRISEAAHALTRQTRTKVRIHPHSVPLPGVQELAKWQLELSYGWLPLLSDAYGAGGYVAHNTQLPQRRSYRVTLRRPIAAASVSPPNYTFVHDSSYCFGAIIARTAENFQFSVSHLAGLDDPAGMVWERLPWSFVADWFIPIQTYLQDRSFVQSVDGLFVTTTGYRIKLRKLNWLASPGKTISGASGTYSADWLHFDRSISSLLEVPLPKLRSFLSVPSWRRALNAASLLVSRHGSS
jgi:hypothetical protein